ncbi:MAG: NifU family protein [Planctomycetes bacterium]|nr:NifU family protein [Planctomycetota bacterium]
MSDQQAQIRIIAKPQINPLKCDFEVDRTIVEGTAYFGDAAAASGSPLVEKLFALEGTDQVLVRDSMLTLTRTPDTEWPDLAKQVGAVIRECLQGGGVTVHPDALAQGGAEDDRMRDAIQTILDADINPAIASHGGVITLLDVQNGVVYVRMGGGCQGCASSTATLKQGVEQSIRDRVPGVVEILDTTDHAAGSNPYYSPAY